jgi:hypothetical protein
MSPMPLHALVGALVVGVWSAACNAATFELAKRGTASSFKRWLSTVQQEDTPLT